MLKAGPFHHGSSPDFALLAGTATHVARCAITALCSCIIKPNGLHDKRV
jgi:hypothetical protein